MKILVVDDDEQIIQLIRPALIQQNYTVEVAMDGQIGFDLLANVPCSLILLDVMLPKLNGIQFCQKLRAQRNETPVLMMTGKDSSTDKVLGLDAGADDYIVKPVDIDELIARIRALLRRGTTNAPILEWGSLRLDPSVQEISYAGQPLNLRPKELAIMELLLRHKQRVLSCQMILDHLWGLEACPDHSTVKAHIRGIRRALESVGAGNLIETLYGKGYRLNPAFLEQPFVSPVATPTEPFSQTTAKIWQQNQHLTWQRLQVLKDAVQTLEHYPENQAALQQAETVSHQLAGILGSYDFHTGSCLAKQVEQYFKQHRKQGLISPALESEPSPIVTAELKQWILALDQSIRPLSTTIKAPITAGGLTKTIPLTPAIQPCVLIVSCDQDWVHQLTQAEKSNTFQFHFCLPAQFNQALVEQQPNVVVLDLSELHQQNDLNFLQELLQNHHPLLPILGVVDPCPYPIHLSQKRLNVAKLEVKALLQKTWQPSKILNIIADFIPSNIKALAITPDVRWEYMMSQLFSAHQIQLTYITHAEGLLNWLDQVRPEILILDNRDENLSAFYRTIRADPHWMWLPIFLLNYTEDPVLPQPLLTGVDGYLTNDRPLSEWVMMIRHSTYRVRAMKRIFKDELLPAIC